MKFFTRITLLIFLFSSVTICAFALTAGFTADVTAGCAPLVVTFKNTSTGATSYFWDFGTGTTSTLPDPSTSFLLPGTYTVKMTAKSGGTSATTTMVITVYPSPTVSFTADKTGACPGTTITFTSTTTGGVPGPITYVWAFGDGGISKATTPTHVYASPGYYNVTLTATNAMGCVSTLTMPAFINIYNPPIPDFAAATRLFCKAPGNAVFTNFSSGAPALTHSWRFGDGGTSVTPAPSHTYAGPGMYDVTLITKDGNGCVDSITKPAYITVANLKANFTAPATACVNTVVTFPNISSPHISADWDYGDGGKGTTITGTHVYGTAGTYTVRLIVFDGGCYDTIKLSIVIKPGPVVSFTQTPLQPCPPPVGITFIGTVPSGTSVAWNFGDGGTGTGVTATHTYARRGIYTITMNATDPGTGCVSTAQRTDTLYDMDLRITPTPKWGCKPLNVTFTSAVNTHMPDTLLTYPYPYPVTSYKWTYGDGSPTVTGSGTATHTYTAVGKYRAYLTITTSNGCTFTDTTTVLVGAPPVVTFTAVPTHVCYKEKITYLVTVVSGPIDDLHWEFGGIDDKFDTALKIVHTFPIPGIFSVTLTPTYNGCVGAPVIMKDYITVDSPKSIPNWKIVCSPANTVNFTDNSMGDDSWLWVFGDGTTSTLKNPTHTYPLPIAYTGYLATYNAKSGCRDTAAISVDFRHPATTIKFKPNVCAYEADTFTATTVGGGSVAYQWCGTTSFFVGGPPFFCASGSFVTDTFHVGGIHTVTLTTTYADGCSDNQIFSVNVSKPSVNFTATPTSGCWPLTVTFTDASTDAAGFTLTRYAWAYGDGGTATTSSKTISHTFTAGGTFTTKEIAISNIGCRDSASLPLVTVTRPKADFSVPNQFPCVGDSLLFTNKTVGFVSCFWMFGDGNTSTLVSPKHAYAAAGTYTVRLAVVDATGCIDTAVYTSYIKALQPNVGFYMVDSFSICPPLLTNFFNTTTGASTYLWDLGDGTKSVVFNPSNLYTLAQTYTVTLTATDANGCTATAYGYPTIFGNAGSFSYSPLTGCSPLTVKFRAKTANVPNITWDFSDGSTSKFSYSDTAEHTYVLPGAYVPKLILSDNTGCQASALGKDTIKVDQVIPLYTAVPNPICLNDTVHYNDISTSFFSTITTRLWTFADGSTSTAGAPTFFYDKEGTFPFTFVATDGWGCTGTISETITVHPKPTITASNDTVICLTDKATLIGTGGVTYTWDPPATLSCVTCNPTKASPTVATTYTVTGTDQYGCSNTDTVLVTLITKVVSNAWGDTEVCRNEPVRLVDSGGSSYLWIPGTGLSSPTAAEPIATPEKTTRYIAVAYLGSCTPDTNIVWVNIHQLPTVDAGPDQRLIQGSVAQLQATGTLIEKYSWDANPTLSCDTCLATQATTSLTATYTIRVMSDFGCKASDDVKISIYCDESQIFVPNTFTPNGDGQNDVFYPRAIGLNTIKSFRIYNRWGQLLFEKVGLKANDASSAWDGSYQGTPPKPDVYVYVLEALCATGEPINIKGDVTIIQ